MTWAGPLTKPARGSGRVALQKRKQAQRVDANRTEKKQELEARLAWALTREDVWARDGQKCRAFGEYVTFDGCHIHHLTFRSETRIGADTLPNLCTLSAYAHALVHRHELIIEGDANGTLTFTRVNLETGEVRHTWPSPCPSPPEEQE